MYAEKTQETNRQLKLVVIGDAGIGKTCLTKRFVDGTYDEEIKMPDFTLLDVITKTLDCNEREVDLKIWDTNGTEKHFAYTTQFLRDAQGAVITYSITKRSSFDNLIKHTRRLEQVYDHHNFPIVCIVGTMLDDMDNRCVEAQEARQWAEQNLKCSWLFFEVSAKSNFRVNDAFYFLVAKIIDTPRLWLQTRDNLSLMPFDARKLSSKDKTTKCKC